MQDPTYGLRRISLPRTGVKIDSAAAHFHGFGVARLERVMDLGEKRIEMRIPWSAWFPCDFRFPHS